MDDYLCTRGKGLHHRRFRSKSDTENKKDRKRNFLNLAFGEEKKREEAEEQRTERGELSN